MVEVLKTTPVPAEIVKLGEEGLKNIWREAKLRGRGYNRVSAIISYAKTSVGLTDGTDAGRVSVR